MGRRPGDGCRLKAFPLRHPAGARYPQRVRHGAGHAQRVRDRVRVQTEGAARAGSDRIRELRRMVESLLGDWRQLHEPALDLIGDCQRGQEVAAVGVRVLGRGEDAGEIVRRMARFASRHEVVHEVEVADESGVVARRAIGRRLAAGNQRRSAAGPEIVDLLAERAHRRAVERSARACKRVEHADLQCVDNGWRKVFVRSTRGKRGQIGRHRADALADGGTKKPFGRAHCVADLFSNFAQRGVVGGIRMSHARRRCIHGANAVTRALRAERPEPPRRERLSGIDRWSIPSTGAPIANARSGRR